MGRLDFNTENDFETLFDFPSDVKIDYDDIILVYLATEVIPGGGGEPPFPPTFVWEALPKTMYLEKGELTYGFKYSFGSVDSSLDGLHIFLDGSVDLNELSTELTNDIHFRVAVISADLMSFANMDEIEAMISSIPNNEIIVLN